MSTSKRQTMMEFQQGLINSGQITTCTNCIHWKGIEVIGPEDVVTVQVCGKWEQTPPPEVIVVGCDQWELDIPF